LDSRLEGYWVCVSTDLFFKFIWKMKFEIQDSRWTIGLNSSIQPKARGLLHMECNFSLHPIYMKIIHEGFKTTRAKALHTLGAAKEVL